MKEAKPQLGSLGSLSSTPAPAKKDDLATRVLSGWFGAVWMIFLMVMVCSFWWIHNMALVFWVYGQDAYFHKGVRVLPGKPTRFSTGELVPQFPDIVTGLSYFLVVTVGLSLLLILVCKLMSVIKRIEKRYNPSLVT